MSEPETSTTQQAAATVDGDGDGRQPVLKVTDSAREKVLSLRAGEPEPERLALWLEVTGVAGGNYTYDMYFQSAGDASPDDVVQTDGDLTVVITASSVDKVSGATLDLSRAGGGGMVIINPNNPGPVGGPASPPMQQRPPADLSGDVPQRVLQVLAQQINPSIASHGGYAELVAVEDGTAYLRLSGGCQGCGLAAVTLTQGIEVAIRESVPDITRVVDVTDHASGANPYYEAAKK
jgi:Fe/S biogenesis protein NfuA